MDALTELAIWRQLVVLIPLGAILIAAAVHDARTRKVPNKLTYSSIVVGLVCTTVAFGWGGLLDGFLTVLATFVIGIFLAATGWIGGGDIKLLMGVGAFLGPYGVGAVIFYSVLVGGAMGVVRAIYDGYLWEMLKRMGRYIRSIFRVVIYRTKNLKESYEPDERSKMPFAVAILGGGILAYTEAAWEWPGLLTWYIDQLPF